MSALRNYLLSLSRFAGLSRLAAPVRELGPYALIALIIPGGSLIALGAWALRHRAAAQSKAARS